MMDDREDEFQAFDGSYRTENGTVYHLKSLSKPEDFIREAKLDQLKQDEWIRKAEMRIKKYGEDDEKAKEFLFRAYTCKYSASQHSKFAESLADALKNKEK